MTAIILDCDALARERRAGIPVAAFGKARCLTVITLEAAAGGVC